MSSDNIRSPDSSICISLTELFAPGARDSDGLLEQARRAGIENPESIQPDALDAAIAKKLLRVDDCHRCMIATVVILILLLMLRIALSITHDILTISAAASEVDAAMVMLIDELVHMAGIIIVLFFIAVVWRLSYSIGGSGIAALAAVLPFFGIIYLLYLSHRAKQYLRRNGLQVRLLGISKSERSSLKSRIVRCGMG